MEAVVRELANDPSSVNLADINVVYANDSLSIIHFEAKAKNRLGMDLTNKMEYIYLVQGESKFEGLHELDSDSVFVDTQTWEKKRTGTIYEDLDYDAAIRYLAATFLNGSGRSVGDKSREQPVKIYVPTNTGAWELKNYSDEFGEQTANKYLVLMGEGVFSNSATSNSTLRVVLFVDENSFSFRLFEYGSSPVKDDDHIYVTRIKDSVGIIHDFKLWNSGQSGQIGSMSFGSSDYDDMVDILKKGGEIIVTMKYSSYSDSDYRFKLDVDGFDTAIKYVK